MKMCDKLILDQARMIHRSFMAFRKCVMAKHLSAPERGEHPSCDLTLAQMNMVLLVREKGPVTVKDLAEALQVSPPSVSSMVDRLVEMGVLTREQNQVDRREVIIRTEPSAKSDIDLVERQALGAIVDVLQRIGPSKAKLWCEIQGDVLAALGEPGGVEACGQEGRDEVSL